MLENVRDNEDLVFQVSVVIMMLSNRLGQGDDLFEMGLEETFQVAFAEVTGVDTWRLDQQVIEIWMEVIGVLDDLIQDGEDFIVEVQFFSYATMITNNFVSLVYLVLYPNVLLGERTFDCIDQMKEIHIEMPMLLKSLQLRIEQLVDILIIPSLTCFLRKFIDDWMQV